MPHGTVILSFWEYLFKVKRGDISLWLSFAFSQWLVVLSIFTCACCSFVCLPLRNIHLDQLLIFKLHFFVSYNFFSIKLNFLYILLTPVRCIACRQFLEFHQLVSSYWFCCREFDEISLICFCWCFLGFWGLIHSPQNVCIFWCPEALYVIF